MNNKFNIFKDVLSKKFFFQSGTYVSFAGAVIFFILNFKTDISNPYLISIPIIICAFLSSILFFIYYFLTFKEYRLIIKHLTKNWIVYDIYGLASCIIGNIIIFIFASLILTGTRDDKILNILLLVIPAIFFVIGSAFNFYSLYKIKIDRLKRKGITKQKNQEDQQQYWIENKKQEKASAGKFYD